MDKNTVIGLILIMAIFAGFSYYNSQQLNKGFDEAVAAAEAELQYGNYEAARAQYLNALRYKANDTAVLQRLEEINLHLAPILEAETQAENIMATAENLQDSLQAAAIIDYSRYGAFATAAVGEEEFITLENNLIELKLSTKGGRVYSARMKDYVRHDSTDLILFDGDSTVFGLNFFTTDNKGIQTNDLYFSPINEQSIYNVVADSQVVSLRLNVADDSYLQYNYTLKPDRYSVDFDVEFHNLDNVVAPNQNSISLLWNMYMPQQEKGRQNEENYSSIKYKYVGDKDVEGPRRAGREQESIKISSNFEWVAYQDQFFSSILIADNSFVNGSLEMQKTPDLRDYIRYYSSDLGIPYSSGADYRYGMKFYFGPNHIGTLKREADQLHKIVFLGKNIIGWISRVVIIPVFNFMERYIANYGIIILILTILIKIVLFPLTFKSYQSTAKMQIVKPFVDEINARYSKPGEEMKRQQATMDLYKKANISLMGGCLPTLLQFPILFAMFRFFPVSIELRQQPFLWADDLSTYDSILNLPFSIPLYGDHVSLFTLLMTIASILSMRITNNAQSQTAPNQMSMKVMTYVMPIMFLFMFNSFSSGLTYYYFLANVITLGQNILVKRLIDEEKVLRTLRENQLKPPQKSKWQKRLEEAQKQRGYYPKR